MLFSSPVFLFLFLPLVFFLHYFLPMRRKNLCILIFSVLFYYYGESYLFLWLLVSIAVNHLFGQAIAAFSPGGSRTLAGRALVGACVAFNLGLLGYFKYANFFVIEILSADPAGWVHIALPIGISFYTFQCLSYVLDIYRDQCGPAASVVDFGAYISCFPQLIAGPIVRYDEIAPQLVSRQVSREDIYEGSRRFIVGLGKKMLLANPAGYVADQIYAMPMACMNFGHAWLAMIAYTLQIYYDFSGYSDMAIGLGRMLGFRFPENFNYPYISRSIREFWRRWHMTLTRWFTDYVYIPMGGNRARPWRVALNKWTIFLLCGLWHGAAWNFLFFGAYHGLFIVLEGGPLRRITASPRRWLPHLYTLLVILVGFVFFRAESMGDAWHMLAAATGLASPQDYPFSISRFWRGDVVLPMLVGIVWAMPVTPWLRQRTGALAGAWSWQLITCAGLLLTLALAASFSVATTFNPFLYFRF